MRRILAAVCLVLGAAGAMGQVVTSLDPVGFTKTTSENFMTANGRYPGDLFIYTGPAGTFKVPASVVETSFSMAWVPLEILRTPGTYTLVVDGPNGTSNEMQFDVDLGWKFPNLVLVLPEVLIVGARTIEGVDVKYEVSAFGGEDPEPVISCEPASGTFFRVGTTRVLCNATNRYGEKASDVFTVSVIDGPPVISLPADIQVFPESERGTTVKFDVTAYDEVEDVAVPVTCEPQSGSLFPLGTTSVNCTASDSAGNVESASFNVIVTDEKP